MDGEFGVNGLLNDQVTAVLQQISDAVLVLDAERTLRFANDKARSLLGYGDEHEIGGRCRLTTKGIDCEKSCPLTYALEAGLGPTRDFQTVYRTRDGRPVPLSITVLPFFDDDGEFCGAVEILRPTAPPPGVLAAGNSETSLVLRRAISRAAASAAPVVLVGEPAACADVAATIHRFSGLPDELFLTWRGSWEDISPWPAGSVLAEGDDGRRLLESDPPPGWRLLVSVENGSGSPEPPESAGGTICLPSPEDLIDDLPLIVRAQVEALRPAMTVSPKAIQLLTEIAQSRGFGALRQAVVSAVSSADRHLERHHIAVNGGALMVDDVLGEANPLMALEERLLREVLNRYEWRMQEAADRLGVSRVTLWRKLKEHGIARDEG